MSARTLIGLDIGTQNIRAVITEHEGDNYRLLSFGKVQSPMPGLASEADIDLEAVSGTIKNLISEIKAPTKDVVMSLPESHVFTRVIYDMPYLTNSELAQAIKYAAEEFVPMALQDVNLNYQILFRSAQKGPESRTIVFVIATPKALLNKYLRVVENADLKPAGIETELLAASRALVSYSKFSPTTLLIQLNTNTTDFAVVSGGLILLTRSISTGSMSLTRSITQAFGFEITQAEEYKKVYGLNENQLEGKLFSVLKPIIDIIAQEARKVIQAFHTQNPENQIKRAVLSGGGAGLPGLVIYLANTLGLEVQEADPWLPLVKDPSVNAKLVVEPASFSVAVGLSMWEG